MPEKLDQVIICKMIFGYANIVTKLVNRTRRTRGNIKINNMKQVTFKGILVKIGPVERPAEGIELVSLDVMEPGYVDQFGDKKGKDSIYRIKIFNDAINKFPGNIKDGDRVEVSFYLNSKEYKRQDGTTDYNTYMNLASIKKI